jgi:hypothetical protein
MNVKCGWRIEDRELRTEDRKLRIENGERMGGDLRGYMRDERRKDGGRSETGRRQVGGISVKLALEWDAESGMRG